MGLVFVDASMYGKSRFAECRTWTQSFTPVKENYGLGWLIDSAGGERFVGHGGGTPGFSSMLALFPEKEVMVIILGNFFDDNAGNDFLFQRITSALLEQETSNTGELEKFTGRYMLSGNSQRVIAIELTSGNLVAHLPDNSVVPVLLETTMKFRLKGVRNAVGKFIVEHGKVVRMVIEQKGTYT